METTPTDLTENKQTHNQNGKKKNTRKIITKMKCCEDKLFREIVIEEKTVCVFLTRFTTAFYLISVNQIAI